LGINKPTPPNIAIIMHASSSISISSYLNHFETSLNHSIDITNTLTYPWTKSTVAAPLPLVFSVWEKVEKEIHASLLFNIKIGAAAPPPAPARASHSLCPPLTLSPPNPTNRSPPSTPQAQTDLASMPHTPL
jgi:hypothetical protein